jgi:hypothetical protein
LVFLAARVPSFDTRLATENDWGWYAATYDVPASLTLAADAPTDATIVARNTGEATWTMAGAHPVALAYRWLSADALAQLALSITTVDLPRDVPPGQAVQLRVPVAADLPAGDYRLAWGMLQRDVLWFHDRGYPDAETAVHVPGGPLPRAAPAVAQEPRSDGGTSLAPVPRLQLWRAAFQMIVQHPWLGIGPDNFRHTYGAYLDLPSWDDRVHANNLYLELLADLGVLGSAGFALVLLRPIVGLVRGLRSPLTVVQGLWLAGLGASLLAFFVHGTLDYFLEFTPVYLLFWLIVGLAMAAAELEPC